jgi:putative DNA methylase
MPVRVHKPPLLTGVDWATVDAEVNHQQRNRELHTPPISLFRWWARRPHALIGALLDAAVANGTTSDPPTVGDPFSGGGTVAIEAARRGMPTYAQDLHPWAVSGLHAALDGLGADDLGIASDDLLTLLAPIRDEAYGAPCPRHGDASEVLTAFWVREVACPSCQNPVYLYPYPMITRASRARDEEYAWWGCTGCGAVTCSRDDTHRRTCGWCGRPFAPMERPLLKERLTRCRTKGCGTEFDAFQKELPGFHLALVQRLCREGGKTQVHFDRPTEMDRQMATVGPTTIPTALRAAIPAGLETRVLEAAGHRRWADLYTPRQLRVMLAAVNAINELQVPEQLRSRLRLAVCGAAEMAGHVCRWDRFYPKAFEATANHRYAVTGLSCEVNLLATRGRGTIPRRLAASRKAAEWSTQEMPAGMRARWRPATGRRTKISGVLLATGPSSHQLASNESLDLVLTDPPYFDDVQYGELAALFLSWARAMQLIPASVELDLAAEVVPNPVRGTGIDDYRTLLTAILKETARALKAAGRVIITFHNRDIRAWWALSEALKAAGFCVAALAVAQAENDADHSKRGRRTFTKDLVIECKRGRPVAAPVIAWCGEDDQSRELVAAGRAVAAATGDFDEFKRRFRAFRGDRLSVELIGPRSDRDEASDRVG